MSARTFRLVIPVSADRRWLNANHRTHKARQAPTVRAWREAANWYARAARLPGLHRARITAELRFSDQKRRDDHNYYPTVKAIIDGLVDYGLLPDDSREHLLGTELVGGEPVARKPYGPTGEVVLTIREVA